MEGIKKGRLVGSVGGLYNIMTDDGLSVSCRPRGHFRYEKIRLLPGDIVDVVTDENGNMVIDKLHERKNALIRPPLSNLDILFCVATISNPVVDFLTFDKLISIAEFNKIEPVIIVSKSDLDPDGSIEFAEKYKKSGFAVFVISSKENDGINEISNFIKENKNKTAAFSGASGVGKSSLLNAVFPGLSLEVGSLSRKTGRGCQTTRQCNLYPLSDLLVDPDAKGFLADTPGFSMLDFVAFDFYTVDDLPHLFREFAPYLGECKFTKCRHLKEQGCAVIEALNQGKFDKSRHDSFLSIYNDLKDKKSYNK